MQRPELSASQRLQAASLTGRMQRLVVAGGEMTLEQAVDIVHQISTDPLVIGQVLGDCLEAEDQPANWEIILGVLQAAGADEVRAGRVAAWQRWRHNKRESSDGHPVL